MATGRADGLDVCKRMVKVAFAQPEDDWFIRERGQFGIFQQQRAKWLALANGAKPAPADGSNDDWEAGGFAVGRDGEDLCRSS